MLLLTGGKKRNILDLTLGTIWSRDHSISDWIDSRGTFILLSAFKIIQITLIKIQSSREHWKPRQRASSLQNFRISDVLSCITLLFSLEFSICERQNQCFVQPCNSSFPPQSQTLFFSSTNSRDTQGVLKTLAFFLFYPYLSRIFKYNPVEDLLFPKGISMLLPRGALQSCWWAD